MLRMRKGTDEYAIPGKDRLVKTRLSFMLRLKASISHT